MRKGDVRIETLGDGWWWWRRWRWAEIVDSTNWEREALSRRWRRLGDGRKRAVVRWCHFWGFYTAGISFIFNAFKYRKSTYQMSQGEIRVGDGEKVDENRMSGDGNSMSKEKRFVFPRTAASTSAQSISLLQLTNVTASKGFLAKSWVSSWSHIMKINENNFHAGCALGLLRLHSPISSPAIKSAISSFLHSLTSEHAFRWFYVDMIVIPLRLRFLLHLILQSIQKASPSKRHRYPQSFIVPIIHSGFNHTLVCFVRQQCGRIWKAWKPPMSKSPLYWKQKRSRRRQWRNVSMRLIMVRRACNTSAIRW